MVCIGVLLSTFGWQSRVFVCCEEKHLSDIAFSYFCEFCCVARKTDQNFPQPVVQEELNFHDNLLQIRCCYLPEDIFYAKNSFQRCCFSFFLLVTETRFFEMLVPTYQITRCHIPEDTNLYNGVKNLHSKVSVQFRLLCTNGI